MEKELYFNSPGGKMKVSKEAVELMNKYGVPCNKEKLPSEYTKDGYNYKWFTDEDGRMHTLITPLKPMKKTK